MMRAAMKKKTMVLPAKFKLQIELKEKCRDWTMKRKILPQTKICFVVPESYHKY